MAYHLSKQHQVRSNRPKKIKKHTKKRIQTPRPDTAYKCVNCGKTHYLSIHHIFYGSGKRDLSSEYKCVDYL